MIKGSKTKSIHFDKEHMEYLSYIGKKYGYQTPQATLYFIIEQFKQMESNKEKRINA